MIGFIAAICTYLEMALIYQDWWPFPSGVNDPMWKELILVGTILHAFNALTIRVHSISEKLT